jgi:ABC-type Fe3+/spermidine/putrescine transport system ATPase subunit
MKPKESENIEADEDEQEMPMEQQIILFKNMNILAKANAAALDDETKMQKLVDFITRENLVTE